MAESNLGESFSQPNGVSTPFSAAATVKSETLGKKRQRRPSVRLGEIGGGDQQHYSEGFPASNARRRQYGVGNQCYRDEYKRDGVSKAQSRTRALTNLAENETLEGKELNLDVAAIGSWRGKETKKRVFLPNVTSRRARSGWGKEPKFVDTGGGGFGHKSGNFGGGGGGGEDIEGEEEGYNGIEFNQENENSDSPLEEEKMEGIQSSPLENLGDGNERDGNLLYQSQNHYHDGVELSGPSDNDEGEYTYGNNAAGCSGGGEDGVRIWLNSIGLGRYAPVFEVHEVDDEVLPMLTLEDLKDMGISAVGSRRKMYCAIQKLGRGFS